MLHNQALGDNFLLLGRRGWFDTFETFQLFTSISYLWSLADEFEVKFDKKTSKSIYRRILLIEPKSIDESILVALAHLRLNNKKMVWQTLNDLKLSYPDNAAVEHTILSVIVLLGEYSQLILRLEAKKFDKQYIQTVANFIATEIQLPSFVQSSPILLDNPKLYNDLFESLFSEMSKHSYDLNFGFYIIRLLTLSDVDSGIVARFREVFEANSEHKLDQKSSRIYDMNQKMEMPITNFSKRYFDYYDKNLDDAIKQTIELNDPLRDIQIWSPWIGALTNFPDQPLHIFVSKLYRFLLHSYPKLGWTASHLYDGNRELPLRRRKIRIAFYFHDSMPMISGLLKFFDRQRFEVIFLFPGNKSNSNEAIKWSLAADKVMQIWDIDFDLAISQIESLKLDIIISGPSTYSVWITSIPRLAKIQAILLEPAWTDGSPNLDYYISWNLAEPSNSKLYYKSKTALMNHPPYWIEKPEVFEIFNEELKLQTFTDVLGFSPSGHTYCIPSTLAKISPQMDYVINHILLSDPESIFLVFRAETLGGFNLKARLRKYLGDDLFTRVVFLDTLERNLAHRVLNSVDCVIDSFPLTGMSSSFDAIKMGIPVVTLASDIPFGKWTQSIYSYLEIDGLVASSKEELVRIACNVASNSSLRSEIRERLILRSTKFIENEIAALELVHFIENAWQRYSCGLQPENCANGNWC